MKKKWIAHLIVQLLLLILACGTAGFTALVALGVVGGTSLGVAPQQAFGLVGGLICPAPERLEYTDIRRSYHRPGESEPRVECVSPDGKRRDVTGQAIATVLGVSAVVSFLLVFMVIYLPLGLLGLFVVSKIKK